MFRNRHHDPSSPAEEHYNKKLPLQQVQHLLHNGATILVFHFSWLCEDWKTKISTFSHLHVSWVSKDPKMESLSMQSVPVHAIKTQVVRKPNYFLESYDCIGKLKIPWTWPGCWKVLSARLGASGHASSLPCAALGGNMWCLPPACWCFRFRVASQATREVSAEAIVSSSELMCQHLYANTLV